MSTQLTNIEEVSSKKVACNGEFGDSISGHPLVWFQIAEESGEVVCPYCEKKFVYKEK